ncbi:hypothetical protein MKEN_01320000 [Mycena kentingensis (nom. inval.)]|nr:hypothetical protein MKEN_01320000 [Mycena kentingensis (nom. inval.)]
MSRSPAPLYNLTSALAVTHLATSLATVLVYEVEDARDSQFIAVLSASATFYMVYFLIPHTTQKESDPVARLNKQFVIVNFLLLCWLLAVGVVPLTVGPAVKPLLRSCSTALFASPTCITVGMDVVLPFGLIATLAALSWRIYNNAHYVQLPQSSCAPVRIPSSPLEPELPPYTDAPPRTPFEFGGLLSEAASSERDRAVAARA